ncbi:hypothetical protein M0R45_013785 [Rubus argutus]|uniref:Uncharacterized protein n=1 Tax=Rubus argutus TaxID=59490 RepID=A0AAW1XKU0_RUBAR
MAPYSQHPNRSTEPSQRAVLPQSQSLRPRCSCYPVRHRPCTSMPATQYPQPITVDHHRRREAAFLRPSCCKSRSQLTRRRSSPPRPPQRRCRRPLSKPSISHHPSAAEP